jgi:large subunit ribosomal protein L17
MRHRVKTKHFNRDSNHRKHLLRNLVRELILHGAIDTTKPKAKVVKGLADKLIYRAQTDTVANRRLLHRFFGKRDVVNTLVDKIAPAMKDRVSGFTTLKSVGIRRGDNTGIFKLELMVKPEGLGTLKSGKVYPEKVTATKKAVPKSKAAKTTKAKK